MDLNIRNVDDGLVKTLKMAAAERGLSLREHVISILSWNDKSYRSPKVQVSGLPEVEVLSVPVPPNEISRTGRSRTKRLDAVSEGKGKVTMETEVSDRCSHGSDPATCRIGTCVVRRGK